jgi:hypothetical protein
MTTVRHAASIALLAACMLSSTVGSADTVTKDQCIDAHSRGQDAREQGRISLARKLFLSCAQSACPALVQGDCARFADDLMRQQSSLTFAARDAQGSDLPDTAVYVDDALIVTRLDDGKPHDVDPGRHTIRFSSGGKDQSLTIVVGTGEKGRAVVATFATINPIAASAARQPTLTAEPAARTVHPSGALAVVIGGALATATGGALAVVGVRSVPSICSVSSGHCTAPPGDPVFQDAKAGMQLVNIGIVVGAVGAAALGGGLYWYFAKARTVRESPTRVVTPMITSDTAGIAFSGQF